MSTSYDLAGLTIASAALAVGGFGHWYRALRLERLSEDMPTSLCRSAAQGYVELNGTQKPLPNHPLRAPLTGTACTWWHYRIEERHSAHNGQRESWKVLEDKTSQDLLVLDDGTGQVLINPAGAEVTATLRDCWHGDLRWPCAAPYAGAVGGRQYRYTEWRMHEGQSLYALGQFRSYPAAQPPSEVARAVSALLTEWKSDAAALVERFDADRDGNLDQDEWERARRAARGQIDLDLGGASRDGQISIVGQPTDRRPFLLSVLPESQLGRNQRVAKRVGLAVFVACAITALVLGRWWLSL